MIEVGQHPDYPVGVVMLHSTESGQFLSCDRREFERLAAAIKRGVADGPADWKEPGS
jgi:hypothetical protein